MNFKTYSHALPFTDKVGWQWPAGDKKLVQVFEHVSDLDTVMKYVQDTSVCVQAGGACGLWPYRLAQLFEEVYTFEPQPENFACLLANTEDFDNIVAYHAPLTNDHQTYSIHNDIVERENWGAGYVVKDPKGLEAMRIDELDLESCGLIQLDVEGYELQALMGAAETIYAHDPVIVLEEKPLNHMAGDPARARKWLENEFGYKLVESIHRDVILSIRGR